MMAIPVLPVHSENNMKPIFACLVIGILSLPTSILSAKKPNALFLMSDDLNTALSGFGHPQCKTPELDKLAERGPRLRTCIANTPFAGVAGVSYVRALSLRQRHVGQCRYPARQHARRRNDVSVV